MVRFAGAVLPIVMVAAALAGCQKKAPPPEQTPVVIVANPIKKMVTDWDDYTGRFEAVETVEVRPRVSGLLEKVNFADGQMVKKGAVLFVIDQRPFAAQLAQARAQVAKAQATLTNAEVEARRGDALLAARAISQAENEARTAARLQAVADLAAARAAVDTAALNLSFTQVVAPVSGRASYRRLSAGNLVAAEQTLLTTIVTQDPIRFVFDAPESALLKYQREGGGQRTGNPVDIRLQDETEYRWKGRIDFIDNSLDQGSGTIRGRAVVANPSGFLAPGMFGQMRRMSSRAAEALMIPDQAVVNDQTRQVAYVVGADGVVGQRTIAVGRLIDGMRVVRAGLSPTDRVVISGVQRARPGRKVDAKTGPMSAFPSGVSRGEDGKIELPPGGPK
jgi:RND family efflux transporter MFP subunit